MKRAIVTGLGVASPIGLSVEAFWQALCAGRRQFATTAPIFPGMKDGCIVSRLSQEDREKVALELPDAPAGLPDSSAYALHAALQAVRDAGLTPGDAALRDALVCVGNSEGEADLLDELVDGRRERWERHRFASHSIASRIANAVGSRGPAYTIHNTCASGNIALQVALRMLRAGMVRTALIGGGDAFAKKVWTGFHTLNVVGQEPCRPFATSRRLITVAEGGAFLVLRVGDDVPTNAGAYAELCAAASNNDARHPTSPDVDGVSACHRLVAREAGICCEDIDAVFAHGTGTRANDAVEAAVFSQHYRGAAVTAMKGTVGHLMATAGVLGAVASCLALRDQIVPPTLIDPADFAFDFDLVMGEQPRAKSMAFVQNNSFGFGGNNAITLFNAVRGDGVRQPQPFVQRSTGPQGRIYDAID